MKDKKSEKRKTMKHFINTIANEKKIYKHK